MLLILIVPIIIFLFKGLLLQEFLIGTFYIHFGHDKSNNKSNHYRNPKIHNLKHLNTGITLHRQCSVKTTEVQKPAGNGNSNSTAQLNTKRGTGVHGSVYSFVLCQISIFRTGSNHCIHISLPWSHTKGCNTGKQKH